MVFASKDTTGQGKDAIREKGGGTNVRAILEGLRNRTRTMEKPRSKEKKKNWQSGIIWERRRERNDLRGIKPAGGGKRSTEGPREQQDLDLWTDMGNKSEGEY